MSNTAALRRPAPTVLADLVSESMLKDAALVVGAAGLVGVLAQVSVHLAFTPVPITGQTLAVLVCATSLGLRRATLALSLYALAGLLGVPWFAGHAAGYVGASFGYIVGFVLAAALCGFLAERRADRSVWRSVPAMLAGEIVMYAVGVTWLGIDLHVGAGRAIALGLTPFVAGDALKAALAALALPAAWKLTGSRRGA